MENTVIAGLAKKYLDRSATAAELQQFYALVREGKHDEELKEILTDNWLQFATEEKLPASQSDTLFTSVWQQAEALQPPQKAVIVSLWKRVAVAVAILLLCGMGVYLLLNKKGNQTEIVNSIPADIKAPATNKATITLADGKKVYLDSMANGQLAMQGNIKLLKLANGQIEYSRETGDEKREMVYNTLTNPRGSKVIDMILSDGSHIWLNAGSSVTYPVAFINNERRVSITGEAYFEITHDASKPFYVSFGSPSGDGGRGGEVEVLGTHFNINSYDDEEMIRTTLLEGKVKISSMVNRQSAILKPGQQAVLIHDSRLTSHDSRLTIHDNIDTDQVMAWKNGLFSFKSSDIKTIMRQISRWYDVKVNYEGTIPQRTFTGEIPQGVNLSELLHLLEVSKIRFTIDATNKKLTVKP